MFLPALSLHRLVDMLAYQFEAMSAEAVIEEEPPEQFHHATKARRVLPHWCNSSLEATGGKSGSCTGLLRRPCPGDGKVLCKGTAVRARLHDDLTGSILPIDTPAKAAASTRTHQGNEAAKPSRGPNAQ